jgi:hypothetical protein
VLLIRDPAEVVTGYSHMGRQSSGNRIAPAVELFERLSAQGGRPPVIDADFADPQGHLRAFMRCSARVYATHVDLAGGSAR